MGNPRQMRLLAVCIKSSFKWVNVEPLKQFLKREGEAVTVVTLPEGSGFMSMSWMINQFPLF